MSTLHPSTTSAHVSAFKTPIKHTKSFRSRAFNDENSMHVYPQTTKKSGGKKAMTQGVFSKTIGRNWNSRRINRQKGLKPLAEITNNTPHPKKNQEKSFSKSLKSLDIHDSESEVTPSSRRLSSTRKTTRLPVSVQRTLKTPISGDPWDVSDGNIDVELATINPAPLEDEDEVEYYPPTAFGEPFIAPVLSILKKPEPDHGLDLEFPDYTLARRLFHNSLGYEIPQRTYEVNLTTEAYQLELHPLGDLLIHEKPQESKESSVNASIITKTRPRATVGHSRIPSLSKQYITRSTTRNVSTIASQASPNSAIPLRPAQKRASNLRTQVAPIQLPTGRATLAVRKPSLTGRSALEDTVNELLVDSEVENVLFEL